MLLDGPESTLSTAAVRLRFTLAPVHNGSDALSGTPKIAAVVERQLLYEKCCGKSRNVIVHVAEGIVALSDN